MLSRDIVTYSKTRYELRAYMCYLFTQNIKNFMPSVSLDVVQKGLMKIKSEIKDFDSMYILDKNGTQVSDTYQHDEVIKNDGKNFANRAYFYEALDEQRCIITNPYPSRVDGNLVVTAAYPVYNHDHELLFVVCIDIHLQDAIKISSPSWFFGSFSNFSIAMYFIFSLSLSFIALVLTIKGMVKFWSEDLLRFDNFKIEDIFESTILLTLALAIFDLVKAIFEEEVLGKNVGQKTYTVHKTMIRFLGSIIVALAIEALMLVFKFTIYSPEKLLYSVYLIVGVAVLLIALAIYVKFAFSAQDSDE
ncbi:hypothetical protein DCO58_06780 [Helicobacter saguini]|uniref:General glycosylation pathway protein n=1 Tax=Helicobacter saguini TaxID=1548018 RepID=A0A347W469_9HELI|nr:PDC sensor domain-containing protein [Helicobacter saguini]MWV61962.1 hypothetical protein [Helicobacter saguini]MWV67363.1 hypothetical protein [Helicobacter saguini]MWV69716.1 hypothetical protein [Helicobacter saguini]MWV73067.1 hypothetical protein [Helicobacter saguini]TLD95560.1 hypothetical protein LS64_001500 [Helicobacter saguini]